MNSFNLSDMMTGVAQKANPQVAGMPTMSSTGTPAAAMPAAPPTWMDTYNQWLPTHKAQFGDQDMNRSWNTDADAMKQKDWLDAMYQDNLKNYNTNNGTNHAVDQSMLGYDVQPNTFTPTDHSHDGFFGPVAKSLGMSTNDLGLLAAIAAGGYGAYSSGLFGGAGAGAAGAAEGAAGLGAVGADAGMYSLAGGTGTLGSASTAGTTAGMTGQGLTAAGSSLPSLTSMGGGTGVLGSLGTAAAKAGGGSSLLSNLSNIRSIGKSVGDLYSAYTGREDARNVQSTINDQMNTLRDMYKEGSPWANALKEQLARKDAAAGRNSQYGARLAQYQALLADKAGQNAGVLGQLADKASGANTNANNYTNFLLNSLGNVSDKTGLTSMFENKATDAVKSVWDTFFGG